MADPQFNPNDAKQLALEIEKIYKRMGQTSPFKSSVHTLTELKEGLEEARDMLMDWQDGIGDIEAGFKAILNEVKATNNSFTSSKRNLSSLSSISSQLRDHQLGISQLSSKQLTTLKSKLDSELKSLSVNAKGLADEEASLVAQSRIAKLTAQQQQRLDRIRILSANVNGLLQDRDSLQQQLNDKIETEINHRENIEKKLGVTGGILRGISKIPILGDLVDTNEALHIAESTIETTESSVKGLGAAMGNLGKQAISGLLNPANLVLGAFTLMGKVLKDVDKGAGDFAKSMNITYSDALNVRGEMAAIASSSGDVALNSARLQESLGYINQQLGTNGKLSEQDLITFTKLREQSGLTNEQLFAMQKYTMATGGTLEDNVATFQATSKILSYQNKVSINTKQLMVDMGNVSNRTKLSIEGGAEGLARAAFNAKLMGGNLEQVAAIADQLLNFESSIEAELSAELLTGKDITLEKARQAALNNDLATVASEITNQIGSAAKYSEMNRIQQEAMAKAVGMNADQLADVLVEQEAIRAIGGKLSDDEQRAFETAKGRYGLEQASKMLKAGQLDQLVDQQSIQDRFNQSVEKLRDIFVSLAEPVLQIVSPIANLVGLLASVPGLLQGIIGGFTAIKLLQIAIGAQEKTNIGLQATMNLMKGKELITQIGIATAWALANPFQAALGIGAAAAVVASIYSSISSAPKPVGDFGYSNKTGETTISTKEGGLYAISPNDEIAVAPRINTRLSTPRTQPSTSPQDNSALIAELRAIRNELNNRSVVVHSEIKVDGEKIATASNNSNRKNSFAIS